MTRNLFVILCALFSTILAQDYSVISYYDNSACAGSANVISGREAGVCFRDPFGPNRNLFQTWKCNSEEVVFSLCEDSMCENCNSTFLPLDECYDFGNNGTYYTFHCANAQPNFANGWLIRTRWVTTVDNECSYATNYTVTPYGIDGYRPSSCIWGNLLDTVDYADDWIFVECNSDLDALPYVCSDDLCDSCNGTSLPYPACLDFSYPPDPRIWVSRTMCQGSTSSTTVYPSSAVQNIFTVSIVIVALIASLL